MTDVDFTVDEDGGGESLAEAALAVLVIGIFVVILVVTSLVVGVTVSRYM